MPRRGAVWVTLSRSLCFCCFCIECTSLMVLALLLENERPRSPGAPAGPECCVRHGARAAHGAVRQALRQGVQTRPPGLGRGPAQCVTDSVTLGPARSLRRLGTARTTAGWGVRPLGPRPAMGPAVPGPRDV